MNYDSKLNTQRTNSVKEDIAMLVRLLRADRDYRRIRGLTPEQKADNELERRILMSMTDRQKDGFVPLYERTRSQLVDYFTKNKGAVRCPITEWVWVLKELNVNPTRPHILIAQADNALHRWRNKTGEWEEFETHKAALQLKELKKKLNALLQHKEKEKAPEEFKGDILEVFDGKL